jgi:hypothetical protein
MSKDEIKPARKVEQKTVCYTICYYSQSETVINRENDQVKKKLLTLKEENENGLSTFSFTIGEVYPFEI